MVFAKTNKRSVASEHQETIHLKKELLLNHLVEKVTNLAPSKVFQQTERLFRVNGVKCSLSYILPSYPKWTFI